LENALRSGEKVFNMSGGEQLRDYLPVHEVAKKIVEVALMEKTDGIFNCSSGVPVSVRNLVESYLKKSNRQIEINYGYYPYREYEPMAFWGKPSL
jgi:UDP-glucose 4-epimerase